METSVSQNSVETDIKNDRPAVLTSVGPAPADCALAESIPGAVLLPGFVDAHIHFPQTRVIGSASGPLLEWLERSVFPEESRFADRAQLDRSSGYIVWQCALCGDHGMIHGWEDTLWNRDADAPPASTVPPSTATH